ncbi:MAG TPA: Gfo/Idh/MocA family oxidoreductase [Spirochaetes bacterium]|nr:Gfo/Idh/MocA family oxidoreductase [Spirochaetota bacterium]
MKKKSLCLVGCGMIGHVHAAEYLNHRDRVDLYICDVDKELAKESAARYQAAGVFKSLDEALADPKLDAVDICLPHHLHYRSAMSALEAGKHVFIEKPLANSLKEADAIIDKTGETGLTLAVLENFRYEPAVERAVALMKQGVIGEPFMITIHEISYAIEMTSRMKTYRWRMDGSTGGGGILLDRGVHLMAMANRLGGPVESVYAVTRCPDKKWEVDETSVLTLVHKNGIVTTIILSWNVRTPPAVPMMAVYGNGGSIVEVPEKRLPGHLQFEIGEIRVFSEQVKDYYRGVDPAVIKGVQEYMKNLGNDHIPDESVEKSFATGVAMDIVEEFAGYNVYNEAIKDFLDCLYTGRAPRVGGKEARADIALVFAAYESARTGLPVSIDGFTE